MTLTHLDEAGHARMVDVSQKGETAREATARAHLVMRAETRAAILSGNVPKGEVLGVARVAGIMAAKRAAELIPLCHPLPITGVTVALGEEADGLFIEASVRTTARTGVEMEALTAASVAALTVYDMCKAIDRGMRIDNLRLIHKSGGASGTFTQD